MTIIIIIIIIKRAREKIKINSLSGRFEFRLLSTMFETRLAKVCGGGAMIDDDDGW